MTHHFHNYCILGHPNKISLVKILYTIEHRSRLGNQIKVWSFLIFVFQAMEADKSDEWFEKKGKTKATA
jgi:hypothetical protein